MPVVSSKPHLDKDQEFFVVHDQVNLSATAVKIPYTGGETLSLQKRFRNLFPAAANLPGGRNYGQFSRVAHSTGTGRPRENLAQAGSRNNLPCWFMKSDPTAPG